MSLVKSSATIGFYTLISRLLGFVRDMTIASALGAGILADAFFVAFKIPNFLRRLFAEGAFNAAFVPLYAGMLTGEGREEAKAFADEVFSFLTMILLILSGVCIALMPWLLIVLAPGFSLDPAKYELTVTLTQITFPYILFISLVCLYGGILNSLGKFAAVAATPILMNLSLLFVPPLVRAYVPTEAHGLAIAVFVAGVSQWLWLMWFCAREKMLPSLKMPRLTARVKRLLQLIGPAALGAGVAQINLFIDLIIASSMAGAVSFLYYADRINELPLAVIGIAVGTVLLPTLSKQFREGNIAAAHHSQNRALFLGLFLSIPAAVALMVIAEPIITAIYQRGEFSASDTENTYKALIAFASGLPAFILVKILAPAFYANQDTKTPLKIAMICIGVNIALNLTLIWPFKHVGMAMATSAAGWLNVFLLMRTLKARNLLILESGLRSQVARMIVAAILMGSVLWAFAPMFNHWVTGHLVEQMSALMLLTFVGLSVYGAASLMLRTASLSWFAIFFKGKR